MPEVLSRRQQVAQRFAARLGAPVDRIWHHPHRRKRFYRVLTDRVAVDVMYHTYIIVNGVVCRSEDEAVETVEAALKVAIAA